MVRTYNIIHYEYMLRSDRLVEMMGKLGDLDALYVTGAKMNTIRRAAWKANLDMRVVKYLDGALVVQRH
jgi:hypothetical protein